MVKDFSPEEKLLRLIKKRRKGHFAPEEMIRPEGEEKKDISKEDKEVAPAEVKEEIKKEKLAKQVKEKPPEQVKARLSKKPKVAFNIRYLYIISGVALLSLIVVFIYNILSDREKQELENLERMIAAISEEARVEAPPAKEAETPQKGKLPPEGAEPKPKVSFEEYQKLLDKKSIFAPPAKDRKKPRVPEGPTLRELVRDLRLVGIIPGDESQAIIEDKKSGQTLFLKKGEQIDGIEIKQIQSGRVILGYGEETITLSL